MTAATLTAQRKFTLKENKEKRHIPWFNIAASVMWGSFGVLCLAVAIEMFLLGGFWGWLLGLCYTSCTFLFALLIADLWA